MKTKPPPADREATLAKPLAPEDVRPGDYVAVLDEEHQWCAASWYCDPPAHADDVIHVRLRPRDPGPPLRVVDVCLPFVFVKPPRGAGRTLDLRAARLARLDRGYAERVSNSFAAKRRKRSKR